MKPTNHIDINKTIDRYLADTLSEEEMNDFRQLLLNNTSLIELVQIRKAALQYKTPETRKEVYHKVQAQIEEGFEKEEATSLAAENVEEIPPLVAINKDARWYGQFLLLAISMLIFFSIYSLYAGGGVDYHQLYKQHFHPHKTIVTTTSGTTTTQQRLESQAMNAYKDKDYYNSAEMFGVLQSQNPDKVSYAFYFALSKMAQYNTSAAIPLLEKLQRNKTLNSPIKEQVEWYLALAYLQQTNVSKAVSILKPLTTKNSHAHYQEAKILLAKL